MIIISEDSESIAIKTTFIDTLHYIQAVTVSEIPPMSVDVDVDICFCNAGSNKAMISRNNVSFKLYFSYI